MKTQHLEDWWNEMNKRLTAFHAYWGAQNRKDGDNFPNFMGTGDWDEQFHFFLENVYDSEFGTKENRERILKTRLPQSHEQQNKIRIGLS